MSGMPGHPDWTPLTGTKSRRSSWPHRDLIAGAAILIYQWRRRRQENACPRTGLALLDGAGTVHEILVILKRVALAAFPREQVASLVGEDWGASCAGPPPRADYSPLSRAVAESPAIGTLKELAAQWIKRHQKVRASGEGSGT